MYYVVIVACVGLISQGQEQLIPRKYIRDVTFYFVALGYFCFVCFDGTVRLLSIWLAYCRSHQWLNTCFDAWILFPFR